MKIALALALLLTAASAETDAVLPAVNPAPADTAAVKAAQAPQPGRELVSAPTFTPDRGPARFVAHDRIVLEIPLR